MIFSKESKIFNVSGNIIVFFAGLFLLTTTLGSFYLAVSFIKINLIFKIILTISLIIIMSLILILISAPLVKIISKLTKRQYLLSLILITLITRIIWVLIVKSPITSDFKIMYETAVKFINGDFASIDRNYFDLWVYQLGFSGYEYLIMTLFHTTNPLVIKILNILYCLGTTILVYKIGSGIFNEISGRIGGLFYSLYISSLIMTSALTNDHIATFLFLLGIYVFLCSKLNLAFKSILMGVLTAAGNINRPLGSIVLMAVTIYLLLHLIKEYSSYNLIKYVKCLILISLSYLVIMNIASYIFIASNITQYKLSNRDPLWKFVTGLNYESKGQYSEKDDSSLYNIKDMEERKNLEISLIKERVSNIPRLMTLIKDKIIIMWSSPDDSVFWTCQYLNKKLLNLSIIGIERIQFLAISFYSIISVIYFLKNKKYDKNLFILLVIAGYAFIHFFIEIQTRYKYFMIPNLAVIQGYGVYITNRYLLKERLSADKK